MAVGSAYSVGHSFDVTHISSRFTPLSFTNSLTVTKGGWTFRNSLYNGAGYNGWKAHDNPFLLKSGVSKGNKYNVTVPGQNQPQKINRPREKGAYADELISPVRSRRNVWQINNVGYHGGHFAAYPPKLAETCILAGCPVGGIVLAPFLGSGTTAAAAKSLSRRYIGIEINPEYCTLAKQRIGGDEH